MANDKLSKELLIASKCDPKCVEKICPAFFDSSSSAMFMRNLNGQFVFVNRLYAEWSGFEEKAVIGKSVEELFPTEVAKRMFEIDRRIIESGERVYEELVVFDGVNVKGHTVLASFFPIMGDEGDIVGIGGVNVDVSNFIEVQKRLESHQEYLEAVVEERTLDLKKEIQERKRVEEKLRKNETRLQDIAISSSDWFWEMGPDLRFTYTSDRFIQITGFKREDTIGKSREEFVRSKTCKPEEKEMWEQHILDLNARKPIRDFRYTLPLPDGKTIHVEINGNPIFDKLGEFLGYRGTGRNITEKVIQENELRRARNEANSANKAKSEFLSSMSHELRTPLNAILGFSQLLQLDNKAPLNQNQLRYVEMVLKSGNHLLDLINDVLDLAKIESGNLGVSIEAVMSTQLVDDAIRMIEPIADKCEIKIENRVSDTQNLSVFADHTRLKQCLVNIINNGIKYNKSKGKVSISSGMLDDDILRISISDTGNGIPENKMDDLFRPFARLGAEHTNIEGTGIGLSLTKNLIDLMGGRLGVESKEGIGTTFWIDLPIAQNEIQLSTQLDIETSQVLDLSGHCQKILYIEDNPTNLELMESIFQHISDTDLVTAHTAELGIEFAFEDPPCLILMDINLPGMDGHKALHKLKKAKETMNIPVIAVSARAMPSDIMKGRQEGFDAYITKPLKINKLLKTIKDLLS